MFTSLNCISICYSNWHFDCALTKELKTISLDFLVTAKKLNTWKVHVLIITLWVPLCNCLLQARLLLRWWDWNCSATASGTDSSGEAFHIHMSEATHNLLVRLGIYCCEKRGLTDQGTVVARCNLHCYLWYYMASLLK